MKNCLLSFFLCWISSVFLMLTLGAQPAEQLSVDPELRNLRQSCERLAATPGDEEALTALLEYAKNTNGIDRLRSRAMAGYALSSLFKGDTNLYVRARQSHARAYPDDQHLLRIDLKTCYVNCTECQGMGYITAVCPVCAGGNQCKACNGKGVRLQRKNLKGSHDAGIKCDVCGGSGRLPCNRCNGSGQIARRCQKCQGNPESFVTPAKVYDDFSLIVKGITKWISNEDVYYQHYQAAKSQVNIDARVAAFQELLATYSYREDKGEVEQLLAADLEVLKEQTKGEKELQEQERRAITLLRSLKDSPHPAAAIATLNEYLESHPESEHRLELQNLVNNMSAELHRQNIKRRNLYIFGGIILLIFAVSCVHINHYNYNVFSHHRNVEEKESE